MFGSLKKKIKDAVAKVSKAINQPSEKLPEVVEPKEPAEFKEEQLPELQKELPEVKEKEFPEPLEEKKPAKPAKLPEFKKEDTGSVSVEDLGRSETSSRPQKALLSEDKLAEEKPIPETSEDSKLQEKLEEGIEEKIERLERIEEKIGGKELAPQLKSEIKEEKQRLEKMEEEIEERGLLRGLTRRITEKKLGEGEIENVMEDLKRAMLENDVALEAAEKICKGVKESLLDRTVRRGRAENAIKEALRDAMLDVLKQERISLEMEIEKSRKPYLILFCGFNGTGKTTTIAKIAKRLKKYSPVLAAGDTFRAASIEQLEEHAKRIGVRIVRHKYGSDSAAVIFDAMKHAEASGSRVVLADTAGRSHSNVNLMDELKKIARVNKPDMKILVLDSLTGNDIYDQSRLFDDAVGIDGVILTKTDVYEKGGAALSASYTIKKPVIFLGTGQDYGDLEEFDPEEIVNRLLED